MKRVERYEKLIKSTTSEIVKNPDIQKTAAKLSVRMAAQDVQKPSSSKVQQHMLTQLTRSYGPSCWAVCPKSMHHSSDCRKFASVAARE